MHKPPKKEYRKRRLFPRALEEVVKTATKPLMQKQGKIYAALLRDWENIVGPERARRCRPERLQFPSASEASAAILHLVARPAAAPELAYETEHMLEQCARYFGYRAISRIVIHAQHSQAQPSEPLAHATPAAPTTTHSTGLPSIPAGMSSDMRAALERLSARLTSASDK